MKNICVLSCLAPEPSSQEKHLLFLICFTVTILCFLKFSLLLSSGTASYCCICWLSPQYSAAGTGGRLSASLLEIVF